MIRFLLLPLALLLGGCPAPQPSSDGYRFEVKEFQRLTVTVSVKYYDSLPALHKAAREVGIHKEEGRELQAFGLLHPTKPECAIHVVDPDVRYDATFIGHEFMHCVHGRFHPNQ